MNKELQTKLAVAYPKIFRNVGGDPMVTCMADGIQCNDGWYDLLDTLCHTMQRWCDAENTRYITETDKYEFVVEGDPEYVQVVAAQVKEKLGELRFYVDGGDATTQGMIQMAENMSSRICELCGNPAKTSRDSGWFHTTCTACSLKGQGWKSGSAEEFLADTDSGSWGWLADSDQPESNPDNNPDKVSGLEDTDSASFQSHCHSCGVPWASHVGIVGICAENAQLRKERDEARRMYCEHQSFFHNPNNQKNYRELTALENNWDCYKQEVSRDTLSQEMSQEEMWDSLNEELWDRRTEMTQMNIVIAQLRRERDEARREVCEMNSIESSNESVDFLSISPQDIADERGWNCYASDTLSQDVKFYTLQDAKLRKGIEEAKQGKFSKTPPKIKQKKKKK